MNFNSRQNMQHITSVSFAQHMLGFILRAVYFIHFIILSYQRLCTCAGDMASVMFFYDLFFALNDRPIIVMCYYLW